MKYFWKIVSELYCFITSSGIKLPIPKFLFNQPKRKFLCKYKLDIFADINFNEKEKNNILGGAQLLEEFSNGMFKFNIQFNLDPYKEVNMPNALLLVKSHSNDTIIKYYDAEYKYKIYGLFQIIETGTKIIYLIHDRLTTDVIYQTTAMHELGHLIGMSHITFPSIMHMYNFGELLYFTYNDAKEFASIYKCSPEDLKYLRSF